MIRPLFVRLVPKPCCHLRAASIRTRTFATKSTQFNAPRRILKYSRNILKLHLTVIGTPLKTIGYLSGAYLAFCLGYSYVLPQYWTLSDHNVLLTGGFRVIRTILNAVFIMVIYKYYYWGVENPNKSDEENEGGPPFGRPNNESTSDDDLTPEQKQYNEINHAFWELASNRIANVLLKNGGVYIKVGQAMATYSAMLPAEFAAALKPLLSSIFERQSGEVEHMFVQDLGAKPEELFSEFTEKPIAGASVAQVFVGRTHEGEKVAIKVQYFDIAKRFKMDKGTVLTLLRALDWYFPGIPFLSVMPHIFDSLEKELDFVNEANNSELCRVELKDLDFLHVPKVHWNLSSRRILTMEFAEGISLIDAEKIKAIGFDSKEIMTKVIRVFSEQIFRTGNIHCDPHPGNIMIRKNSKTSKVEVVLIDHGLYEQLKSVECQAFATFWHSVIIDNYEEVQRSGKILGLAHPDMLATLLFFQPYGKLKAVGFGGGHGGGGGGRGKRKKREEMTEEEIEQMEEMHNMGKETIDSLPKHLALIFRNLRLIQGINLSFGVPVNRLRLMAEIAVRNSTKDTDFLTALKSRLRFEWHFFVLDLRNRVLGWTLWVYSWFAKKREGNMDISQAALFLKA